MSGHTHLYRRGARYYYRGRVPHDLVAVLGKQEIKFSLNTADRREALVRVRERAVEVDQMFAAARRRRDAKEVSEVPEPELERISQEVYARELSGHDEYLRDHPDYDRETVEVGLDAELDTWAEN